MCEMIEKEKKETIDYKMKEVLCLYTKHLDGRRPVNEWDDLFDDNHENDIQRRYKSNLARAYDSFCKKLEENGKERIEKCKGCNRYKSCRKCESCSEYMMNEFAREMIYHRRAIIEFENHMIKLKNISNTMIPRNIRLAEAPSYGIPINMYDSKSAGAESYRNLAKEIIARKDI